MNYAIVVDSSCGLTKKQAEQLGWFYLPLYINIDKTEYKDGVDINVHNLFDKYNLESDVKTSTFNVAEAHALFEDLSKKYDKIIAYPISQHLSSAYKMLKAMESEFPKLRVVASIQVVCLIVLDLIYFENQMRKDPSKMETYLKEIENDKFRKSITLIPKYNKFLVKGGRLSPTAAAIARLLKIVPLIKWENGKLQKEGVGRVFSKATLKSISSKVKKIKPAKGYNIYPVYLHSNAKQEDIDRYLELIGNEYHQKCHVGYISPVISIHTGPEAFVFLILEIDDETAKRFWKIWDEFICQ